MSNPRSVRVVTVTGPSERNAAATAASSPSASAASNPPSEVIPRRIEGPADSSRVASGRIEPL